MSMLRALATLFVERMRFANFAGKTFDGRRDMYAALGYTRLLRIQDFEDRYRRGGIAAKIVDIPAMATWRNQPELESDSKPLVEAWNNLVQRLNVFHFLDRADKLSGIGHYGILLIGAPGNLAEPLPQVRSANQILFLAPFGERNAEVHQVDTDPSSERFGLPINYRIRVLSTLATSSVANALPTKNMIVHHSRVIHIAEGLNEDEIFGTPRLERVWNYLDDLDKVIGGSSEAIWRTVDRGIHFNIDKDAVLDPQDEEDFAKEIEEYMHGLKRFVRTQGVEANVLGADVANPAGAFQAIGALIAGTTGIPNRILFGSERGQLASTQDERNFYSRIMERQQSFAEPVVLRPFINRLQNNEALPEGDFDVNWPDLSTMTRKEQADVAARMAQAIRNISSQGAQNSPTVVISANEFRREFMGLKEDSELETDELPISIREVS